MRFELIFDVKRKNKLVVDFENFADATNVKHAALVVESYKIAFLRRQMNEQ